MSLEALLQKAVIHHKAGELDKAEELYHKILVQKPDSADALHLLGLIAQHKGQIAEALTLLSRATTLMPGQALFHYDLGCALLAADRPQEALAEFDENLKGQSRNSSAWFQKGLAFRALKTFASAAESFTIAAQIQPNFFEAFVNLAAAQKELKELKPAMESLQRALALKPDHAQAHYNLGLIQLQLQEPGNALTSFRTALRYKSDLADAYFYLGNILRETGALNEAIKSYRLGLHYQPDFVPGLCNCGEALQVQGDIDGAEACYRAALRVDPACALAQSNLLGAMHYNSKYSNQDLFKAHRKWAGSHESRIVPHNLSATPGAPGRRLTIGYVSPDFCKHPVSYFLSPILEHHDHTRFKIVCFAQVEKPDATTARYKTNVDVWHDINGLSDEELDGLIQQEKIDVLVDLTGHLAGHRLYTFMRRPAPVQITYLGYPGTTGCATIDSRLTDAILSEGEDDCFSETLVRLAPSFCCYAPPQDAPAIAPPPFLKNGYITFGSLHNLARLNDRVLNLWCELLREIPYARLLVFRNTLLGKTEELMAQRFTQRGIGPERLMLRHGFESITHHMEVYNQIDIALDTLPWSGHTTACEGLWMGVPMITLRGDRSAGRMVASVLTNLGLPQLIAETNEQFVKIGKRFAGAPQELSELRNSLRLRMQKSVLCGGKAFTQNLENTFVKLWHEKMSTQP